MLEPLREAVIVWDKGWSSPEDKTSAIQSYRADDRHAFITFATKSGQREYTYPRVRVEHLTRPDITIVGPDDRVVVGEAAWRNATRVVRFAGRDRTWSRIFYTVASGEERQSTFDSEVQVFPSAAQTGQAAQVLAYLKALAAARPDGDPLRRSYEALTFIDPGSALATYLGAADITSHQDEFHPIFPFSYNTSQREAITTALGHRLSVIDGPPGTGKTQTILNLVASIVATPGTSIGVCSLSNSAVDNVQEKLAGQGLGFLVASLGNKEKRQKFFQGQDDRNSSLRQFLAEEPSSIPTLSEIETLDAQLSELQRIDRVRAETRATLDAFRLEKQHFDKHLPDADLPALDTLPLLKKSSDRILDYLVDTLEPDAQNTRVVRAWLRVKRYFKFGATTGFDPSDTAFILGLQKSFYKKRIAELEEKITDADFQLDAADFQHLAEMHKNLSSEFFRAALRERYESQTRKIYEPTTYRRAFDTFVVDYPVILSTCHSIRNSIPDGTLLDYLIIDEASQVDLLAACLALASCRNLVVVGDVRQLSHIADDTSVSPSVTEIPSTYDYQEHNLLTSLIDTYGARLPRTMLREHYRCAPSIIGFCNKKFYDGRLISYTAEEEGPPSMRVVRTVEGNHMRQHRGGGRSNQREVDVVVDEVIPMYFAGVPASKIGITTPYRLQVEKMAASAVDGTQSDTVHKFQGREKDVIIMSAVLDETWRGGLGLPFVDDPRLVNVAVSRAAKQFVLVTNNDLLPRSQHLRDLIGYIRYQNPESEVTDSHIVSVFDLLYREYSARLRPLAARLKSSSRFPSENIIETVLEEILSEEEYASLRLASQMLVRNLLPSTSLLDARQASYVAKRASVDFVVYNKITNSVACAIEVDGFQFHEDNPVQLERDRVKDSIFEMHGIPLLRLSTTGSGEETSIRRMLDSLVL